MKSELKLIKQQHPELGHKAAFETVCRSWQVSKPDLAQAAAEEKGDKQEMTREEETEVTREEEMGGTISSSHSAAEAAGLCKVGDTVEAWHKVYSLCLVAAWVSLIFFTVMLHSLTLTLHVQSGGWHHAIVNEMRADGSGKWCLSPGIRALLHAHSS